MGYSGGTRQRTHSTFRSGNRLGLHLGTQLGAHWPETRANFCAGFRVLGQAQNGTLTSVDEPALQGWPL